MLPSIPLISAPLEPYTAREPATRCLAGREQPGVFEFRAWVRGNLGGGDSGITRPCSWLPLSDHHEGRAWDWTMSAFDPADAARVEALIGWLLATGPSGPHEMFRRAGLRYIIWNKRIFSASKKLWLPYSGNQHTDHAHFSFGWPGARGETSFFDWLRAGAPSRPARPPESTTGRALPLILGAALGLGVSVVALQQLEAR